MQNPSADLTVARINLLASILILLAALIPIGYAFGPKVVAKISGIEDKHKALSTVLRWTSILFAFVGAILMFAGRFPLGLLSFVLNTILLSIDYGLGSDPAPRERTLIVVISWAAIAVLFSFYLIDRLIDVLIRH